MNHTTEPATQLTIREAVHGDLPAVIGIDAETTGAEKPQYWIEVFERFVAGEPGERLFLIAEQAGEPAGFIIAEVRAWEFGSPPCGWVFALAVKPELRGRGTATAMFEETCRRLKRAGVDTVRTMVARTSKDNLSFFRSMGLRTGPYVELERAL